MEPVRTHASMHLSSGALLLGLATILFFASKRSAKTFLRIPVPENATGTEEYEYPAGS